MRMAFVVSGCSALAVMVLPAEENLVARSEWFGGMVFTANAETIFADLIVLPGGRRDGGLLLAVAELATG